MNPVEKGKEWCLRCRKPRLEEQSVSWEQWLEARPPWPLALVSEKGELPSEDFEDEVLSLRETKSPVM